MFTARPSAEVADMYAAVDYLRLGSVKIPNLLPRESRFAIFLP